MNRRDPQIRQYKGSKSNPKSIAVVRIDGHDHYLGKYGTEEAKQKYHLLLSQWHGGTLPSPKQPRSEALTIDELIGRFIRLRVTPYYIKDGKPTSEAVVFKHALSWLSDRYGSIPAREFGPKQLKDVRAAMMTGRPDGKPNARTTINRNIGRIRQVFRWAVGEELFPPNALVALESVEGLGKGRTVAVESRGVGPVPLSDVVRTLDAAVPVRVRAIIELMVLTAARPGEICAIKPNLIDRSGPIWIYRPRHKTEHHGRERIVPIGPRGQELLTPWLDRQPNAYCFCPAEAIASDWEGSRRPKAGEPYRPAALRKAIGKAAQRAGVPVWHPNQIRHTRATEIRARYGLEAAQVILGHAKADVTQGYAERDLVRATGIAAEIG